MRAPLNDRLWSRVVVPDDMNACWEWFGARSKGYGVLGVGGRGQGNVLAHRLAYELLVGPIPDGLHLDHLCRNRACVNPEHLDPVTQAENNLRCAAANRPTHCKQGHEFTPENTAPNHGRWRRCITCSRISDREAKRHRRAQQVAA